MLVDDALHDGEFDPGAGEVARRVKSLERAEELVYTRPTQTGGDQDRGCLPTLLSVGI